MMTRSYCGGCASLSVCMWGEGGLYIDVLACVVFLRVLCFYTFCVCCISFTFSVLMSLRYVVLLKPALVKHSPVY